MGPIGFQRFGGGVLLTAGETLPWMTALDSMAPPDRHLPCVHGGLLFLPFFRMKSMFPRVHAGLFRQYHQEERPRAMSGRGSGSPKDCWSKYLPTSGTEGEEKPRPVMGRSAK